jgi:glycosyltransferase involved in cell wall biosynthesis
MSIKTLHITNSFHSSSGGIRTFYNAMLDAANRQQRHVRLVVPGAETRMETVGEFGRIYYVEAPRSPVIDSRYRWMLPHLYAWRYESPLRHVFAEEKPQLVEVCDKFWLLYLSGVLRRGWMPGVPVPVIVGLTCERLDTNMRTYISDGRVAQFVCERYMRRCYVPRFDFHIAASDYIAAEIRRLLPQRLSNRLHVCPMGVDYEALVEASDAAKRRNVLLQNFAPALTEGSDSTKVCILLYAGRLSREKNLLLLPSVLANLIRKSTDVDYRLVIAGEGPIASELRAALEANTPGRFVFLGHQQREQLIALYHAADVFVHPNPNEPYGLAPLEAMAAGLPLVAPASGGVLTYATRDNSWLAQGGAESFADAVRAIGNDPVAYARKITNARTIAAQLSWTNVTANYFRLYDEFHATFVSDFSRTHAVPGETGLASNALSRRILCRNHHGSKTKS